MKIFLSLFFSLFLSLSFAQKGKYWENANYNSSFNFNKGYKIGILPVVPPEQVLDDSELSKIAYNELEINLAGLKGSSLISKEIMVKAVNMYRFGGGPIDASSYKDICEYTGAQLLILCELSHDMTIIKKKEVGTIMATVHIFDAASDFMSVYIGKARALNPLSEQSETEIAVRNALNKLKEISENK